MRINKTSGRAKDALRDLGVRPSKERGQNFLIRPDVIESIVSFGKPNIDAHVVEIGPGMGALTESLIAAKQLTLIEIESNFCSFLEQKYPNATIINRDARTVNFAEIGADLFVFGNIPYVYSTEILFQLISNRSSIKHAVLMVQREFAQRVAAPPGGRDYGSLSIAVQVYADVSLGPIVPGDSFHPPTAVESQLMKLSFLSEPRVDVCDPSYFEVVVRGAFAQRRKKVINSLLSRGRWNKEVVLDALTAAGISSDSRAERITIEQFAELARNLRAASVKVDL